VAEESVWELDGTAGPPLRFAPVGMTILFGGDDFPECNIPCHPFSFTPVGNRKSVWDGKIRWPTNRFVIPTVA
jgi:hypothetical protein